VSEAEKEAIQSFLQDPGASAVKSKARPAIWMALKLTATLLVAAGVGIGVGDGNEFDGVDCGVAAKPPGYSKGQESGKKTSGQPPCPGGLPPSAGGWPPEKVRSSEGGAPMAHAYGLRKEFGDWRLVFDGVERFLSDSKGLAYVAVLVARSGRSLHASELANLAFGDAVVEQRNIASDDRETAQHMANARRKCQGVIDDANTSEAERQEARDELEEILAWARKHLRGTEGNEQRQVRAIRQAIRRLLGRLGAARDGEGAPDEVLRAFGEHLERYLWRPSGRWGRGRDLRLRAGLAGRFVYEPPEGVRWMG
jgi:hypothetical protein